MAKVNFIILLKNEKGVSVLGFVFILSIALFIGQQFIMMDQQNLYKNILQTQSIESQVALLNYVSDILTDELALRNSRFNTNSNLYRCLFASPSPCDETLTYDMILYSPNPPIIFTGGTWQPPPLGISKIAGGLTQTKVFYSRAAGICPNDQTEPDSLCPLQTIIQFKPLCGGTAMEPSSQGVPGVCPGRAKGFDITIGIGIFKNGSFIFKNNTANGGDAKIFRFKAIDLLN